LIGNGDETTFPSRRIDLGRLWGIGSELLLEADNVFDKKCEERAGADQTEYGGMNNDKI
jgi:hypothetical protein